MSLDQKKIIKNLEALYDSMNKNQCYACSYEFIELADNFGTEIIADAIDFLKEQPQIVLCKDCKYGIVHGDEIECKAHEEISYDPEPWHKPNWFCADGERKEGW